MGATVCCMTAKEKLRQTVEDLSEAEAQDALGFIVRRRQQHDALGEMLDRAPVDDEPTTPEEDQGVREARAEIARGDVLSADEIRREVALAPAPAGTSRREQGVTSSASTLLSSAASSVPSTDSRTTHRRAMSSSWQTPTNGDCGSATGGCVLTVTPRQAW